jgi:predicted small lipoprotein YifL
MRRTLLFATLIAIALLVHACGTRGPLYLPPPDSGDAADAQKKKQ